MGSTLLNLSFYLIVGLIVAAFVLGAAESVWKRIRRHNP